MNGQYMTADEFEAIKNRAMAFQNEDALKLIEQIETLAAGAAAFKRAVRKEQQLRQQYHAALMRTRTALCVNVRKLKKDELADLALLVREEIVGALGGGEA